ncbi:hypothetical protein BLI708_10060 [Bifidobacterium imperatoris]|uniref:Uncharacterized protein n=1 Tax=Bifidobacterium imperatoris TaxID=2020965 RepID=A0A2N5IPR7_9BIFI|nr:hypothetical protein [Bifidobacterium imperatoris]PLS23942.1 hypothetical protein Tam1G_1985 [Bifidobacterium imperatoris]QSY57546.1 hypothetical protein BLI708_10060 [Bifidobacterium imperatoris]
MKVCEVPLSVNPLSQNNIEPIIMIGVSAGGLIATLLLAYRFLRKPNAWRVHPKTPAWYVVIEAIQIFIMSAIGMTVKSLHKGVAKQTLEQACGISGMHTSGGKVFAWLEDPGYPYLFGETRYGPLWFYQGGKTISGGITLQGDTATVYSGDYKANIAINVLNAGETMLINLFFMALIIILMFVVAYSIAGSNKPIEDEPIMIFVTWLCVFIAAIMTGISIPVVDARWMIPTTIVLLLEDAAAFGLPFWLVARLRVKQDE